MLKIFYALYQQSVGGIFFCIYSVVLFAFSTFQFVLGTTLEDKKENFAADKGLLLALPVEVSSQF